MIGSEQSILGVSSRFCQQASLSQRPTSKRDASGRPGQMTRSKPWGARRLPCRTGSGRGCNSDDSRARCRASGTRRLCGNQRWGCQPGALAHRRLARRRLQDGRATWIRVPAARIRASPPAERLGRAGCWAGARTGLRPNAPSCGRSA